MEKSKGLRETTDLNKFVPVQQNMRNLRVTNFSIHSRTTDRISIRSKGHAESRHYLLL
jgi:hypothetical protein